MPPWPSTHWIAIAGGMAFAVVLIRVWRVAGECRTYSRAAVLADLSIIVTAVARTMPQEYQYVTFTVTGTNDVLRAENAALAHAKLSTGQRYRRYSSGQCDDAVQVILRAPKR